jgi:hypothetical protein
VELVVFGREFLAQYALPDAARAVRCWGDHELYGKILSCPVKSCQSCAQDLHDFFKIDLCGLFPSRSKNATPTAFNIPSLTPKD